MATRRRPSARAAAVATDAAAAVLVAVVLVNVLHRPRGDLREGAELREQAPVLARLIWCPL